jgi:uncharacterized protein YegL
MGWASMNEDNESRYFNATIIRNKVDRVMNNNATTSSSQRDKKSAGPTKLKTFAAPQARPLPVIILADVSGSMAENGKIDALNVAVEQMVASFAKESRLRAEIQVGLITFGGRDAMTHLPLVAAQSVNGITRFSASGGTPMGAAFEVARKLLEDKDQISSRAYRPVLVLVSDGAPTDDWEGPLSALKASERAQKASRIALAIGADADRDLLAQFANDPEAPVFEAHEAQDIRRFFHAVTMSVVARSASATPDQTTAIEMGEIPDDDLDLDAI